MGTIKSSESKALAEYLRSQRSSSQAEADALAREHDKDDITPSERLSALSH